jgi:hypothetical protein
LDSLRRRNPAAIASLYSDFKHQCPQCALRFAEHQKLDEHLDWHFQRKRKEKQKAKKAVSRQWLLSASDWVEYKGGLTEPDCTSSSIFVLFFMPRISCECAVTVKSAAFGTEQREEAKESTVVADESQKNCAACGEAFEQFYDESADEWMYKNAVRGADDKLYHSQCYTGAPVEASAGDLEERPGKKRSADEMTNGATAPGTADPTKRPKTD